MATKNPFRRRATRRAIAQKDRRARVLDLPETRDLSVLCERHRRETGDRRSFGGFLPVPVESVVNCISRPVVPREKMAFLSWI